MDPLCVWWGNQEVVETLAEFLGEQEIFALARSSSRWRSALNLESVWFRICKNRGWHELRRQEDLADDDEDAEEDESDLEPLCEWANHFQRCNRLKSAWRNNQGRKIKLEVTEDSCKLAKGAEVTCYDCEGDLLVLGTLQGAIVVWQLDSRGGHKVSSLQAVKTGRRVNKVYVRHSMVVAVQGGLLQVHTAKPSLALLYCKSLESPDPQKLFEGIQPLADDPAFVPQLTKQELETRYLPRQLVTYPGLDMTVSTKGKARLGLCLTGGRSLHLYCLTSGLREGEIVHDEDEKIFKIGLVHTEAHSGLLYTVLQDRHGRYCGVMHSCNGERLWRLELWSVFDYDHSVFSVFTTTGILIFGRQAGSEVRGISMNIVLQTSVTS